MQDKKNFGKYISEKRKDANLTQEELANKLYVIPTTVSKWERGISYPDITVITNLCRELNISEHEFFTACDDEALNQEKKEIRKYRTIKKTLFYLLNIGYIVSLISCFICNLLIDHKLNWFLIVLESILISFTITSLPYFLQKNKYMAFKILISFSVLIYLLLFTINKLYGGDWLLGSFKITTFELCLLWLNVLVCTFTKINVSYKISFSLILWAICIAITNPICTTVLYISNSEDNIGNNICACVLVFSAIIISTKKILSKKR